LERSQFGDMTGDKWFKLSREMKLGYLVGFLDMWKMIHQECTWTPPKGIDIPAKRPDQTTCEFAEFFSKCATRDDDPTLIEVTTRMDRVFMDDPEERGKRIWSNLAVLKSCSTKRN